METEYEVRIASVHAESWADWFPGIRAEAGTGPSDGGCTVLSVPGRDVALLHGVLAQIGLLNLCLLSVKKIERRTP